MCLASKAVASKLYITFLLFQFSKHKNLCTAKSGLGIVWKLIPCNSQMLLVVLPSGQGCSPERRHNVKVSSIFSGLR